MGIGRALTPTDPRAAKPLAERARRAVARELSAESRLSAPVSPLPRSGWWSMPRIADDEAGRATATNSIGCELEDDSRPRVAKDSKGVGEAATQH